MIKDNEKVYDEQISPLMTKIIEICREHEIPMAAIFQYEDDEEKGAGHCSTALPFKGQSEKMDTFNRLVRPERPFCLAETITTNPDGSKHISIKRIS